MPEPKALYVIAQMPGFRPGQMHAQITAQISEVAS